MAPAAAAVTPRTKPSTSGRAAKRSKKGSRRTARRKAGRNTPMVAAPAPATPATRNPMNAAVITTGPGVSMATAIASRNCRSVSQRCSVTTPEYRKGTMARPLPNTKVPALAKYHSSWGSSATEPAPDPPGEPGQADQPQDLPGLPDRRSRDDEGDAPQQRIGAGRRTCQPRRRDSDDAEHDRAHAVEGGAQPGQSSVPHVEDAQQQGEQERRRDERGADECRAPEPGVQVSQTERDLSGERHSSAPRQCQTPGEFTLGEPAPPLHQVSLHGPAQRDRAAESGAAQPDEVTRKRTRPGASRRRHAQRRPAPKCRNRPSNTGAERAIRSASSGSAAAMPESRAALPGVCGRLNSGSLQSMSWMISPMAPSPGPVRPKRRSRTWKVHRAPSCVYSAWYMSKRSSEGSGR